jgi:hypothetical protein
VENQQLVGLTSRPVNFFQALMRSADEFVRPQAAHLRHGNPDGDTERFDTEAAPPPPA